jgi:2-dehydro-3-deoxygluconokinase
VKLGAEGCLAVKDTQQTLVRAPQVGVVDTTSAGDSFNAGYLSARLAGQDPIAAAQAGHQLASTVIQYKGAIIPREAMPKVWYP